MLPSAMLHFTFMQPSAAEIRCNSKTLTYYAYFCLEFLKKKLLLRHCAPLATYTHTYKHTLLHNSLAHSCCHYIFGQPPDAVSYFFYLLELLFNFLLIMLRALHHILSITRYFFYLIQHTLAATGL